jgi:hypothetical protein
MVVDSIVDRLMVIIMDFHYDHPTVPIDDIKVLVKAVGDITSDFTMKVVQEQIHKTFNQGDN